MSLVPKKEHWTSQDLVEGLCTLDQVGMPIEPETDDTPVTPTVRSMVEKSISPKRQAAFNQWADQNPGVYFPLVMKSGLTTLMKDETKPLPSIDEITTESLQTLDSATLKRILLASEGITKQSALDYAKAALRGE